MTSRAGRIDTLVAAVALLCRAGLSRRRKLVVLLKKIYWFQKTPLPMCLETADRGRWPWG